MNKKMFCVVGDYGIEFTADNEQECREYITKQEVENEDLKNYYQVETYTQAELDAMPEV